MATGFSSEWRVGDVYFYRIRKFTGLVLLKVNRMLEKLALPKDVNQVQKTDLKQDGHQQYIFRMADGQGLGPSLLRQALFEIGMVEYDPQIHGKSQWNFWWKGYRFKEDELRNLGMNQRVNHHPAPSGKQADIIKKDGLLRAVRRMCATYPKCSSILLYPPTFHLPREENKFLAVYCHNARVSKEGSLSGFTLPLIDNSSTSTRITAVNSEGDTTNIWIVKPADQSRGRGIYLFNRLDEFEYVTKSVVQKYITNPLLVEGYKFDLRLYAVVPSYGPFIIYICSDGLVRFATEPFDLNNLKNLYSHLTNASINVSGPGYLVNKPGIGRGCKWNIRQLRQWFQKNALNDRVMWTQIQALIILTLLSQANSISKVANAYELFGFDILIDQQMRPWLIEVNANPALSTDCMVDEMVKKPLVNSVLEMLRLSEPPVGHRSLICLNKQDSRSCKPAKPGFTSNKHLTTTGDRSWRGSIAPDGYSNSLQRLSLQTTATTVTMNTDPQAPLNIMDMGSSCDESASVLSNGTSALRNSSPLSSVCTHRLDRKCARSNTLRPSEGSGSLSQFRSMLLTRPRTDQKRKMKPCPLYGPGSEMLIPELIILAKRYPDVTDSYSDPNQSVRSESLSISSRGRSLRSFRKEDHIKEDSTDKFPLTTEEQDVLTGRYLIPHSFGQLKLAFPFNLVTRIACAKEKSHYPDSKMVVRALSQLVQHRMRELKRGHEIKDLKIIDTPDIWTEMK